MDPLSISASVLTVIAATLASLKALNETVGRYKGRDKTLSRLQNGLNDLINILKSLEEAADDETPILALLKGPVSRCAQVSREFEEAMKTFSAKSKTGLRDWTKMEFMRGDINEFIDTLADYKSTITIGLGTVTMRTSRLTQQVVEEYSEMVQDTSYNLKMRLQRIEEKLEGIAAEPPAPVEDTSIDLQDEKAVTRQCLRICERASSYIESLQVGQPTLQQEAVRRSAESVLGQFEAQLMTQKTLNENRDNLVETISRLRERLESTTFNESPESESEMRQLQDEINYSRQCLEVCKEVTNQVSNQKIHIIGEIITEEDSDQVVVTTLADLFSVAAVKSKSRSAQLVGSMPGDVLQQISKDRYNSRFGSSSSELAAARLDTAELPTPVKKHSSGAKPNKAEEDANKVYAESSRSKPLPNEVRKRT